jgi:hypothetical protein
VFAAKLPGHPLVDAPMKEHRVPKPPRAGPNSDIHGVHQDDRPNVEVAAELNQGAADLAEAKRRSVGRPKRRRRS